MTNPACRNRPSSPLLAQGRGPCSGARLAVQRRRGPGPWVSGAARHPAPGLRLPEHRGISPERESLSPRGWSRGYPAAWTAVPCPVCPGQEAQGEQRSLHNPLLRVLATRSLPDLPVSFNSFLERASRIC